MSAIITRVGSSLFYVGQKVPMAELHRESKRIMSETGGGGALFSYRPISDFNVMLLNRDHGETYETKVMRASAFAALRDAWDAAAPLIRDGVRNLDIEILEADIVIGTVNYRL